LRYCNEELLLGLDLLGTKNRLPVTGIVDMLYAFFGIMYRIHRGGVQQSAGEEIDFDAR
jgi:hypothetical protein